MFRDAFTGIIHWHLLQKLMSIFEKLFGSNKQVVSKLKNDVDKINELEPKFQAFSDAQILEQVNTWKELLKGKEVANEVERQREILNEIMHEVFALTREASRRATGLRHFDVQLIAYR